MEPNMEIELPKVVIGGVACLGKTSFVRAKEAEGYQVVAGEFAEHQQSDEIWRNWCPLKTLAYGAMVMRNLKEGCLHDRCIYDCIVYEAIKSVREGLDVENVKSEMVNLCQLVKMADVKYIVVLWDGDEKELVEAMCKRNNGIDWLSIEYVKLQNEFFKAAAEALGAEVVVHNGSWSDLHRLLNSKVLPFLTKEPLPSPGKQLKVSIGGVEGSGIREVLKSLNMPTVYNGRTWDVDVRGAAIPAIAASVMIAMEVHYTHERCIYDELADCAIGNIWGGEDKEAVKNLLKELCKRVKDDNIKYVAVVCDKYRIADVVEKMGESPLASREYIELQNEIYKLVAEEVGGEVITRSLVSLFRMDIFYTILQLFGV